MRFTMTAEVAPKKFEDYSFTLDAKKPNEATLSSKEDTYQISIQFVKGKILDKELALKIMNMLKEKGLHDEPVSKIFPSEIQSAFRGSFNAVHSKYPHDSYPKTDEIAAELFTTILGR